MSPNIDKAPGERNISVMKYVWCVQHKICHRYHTPNCFPWFVFYEKCMCCCAWEILPSQTSVRLRKNQSADPRWGIIYLHLYAFGLREPAWHWIKRRAEDSSLTQGASYIIELSMKMHKTEPWARINLPRCGGLWHSSWRYSDKSIITIGLKKLQKKASESKIIYFIVWQHNFR